MAYVHISELNLYPKKTKLLMRIMWVKLLLEDRPDMSLEQAIDLISTGITNLTLEDKKALKEHLHSQNIIGGPGIYISKEIYALLHAKLAFSFVNDFI